MRRQRELRIATLPIDGCIVRLRNKTSVCGEWKLWPITTRAIEWWLQQRENIDVTEGVSAMIVIRSGNPYDSMTEKSDRNGQIPGLWNGLLQTIRKDEEHRDFRKLSFGKLRKTAGNLIRKEADGEIAGVFLCHGTPVRADNLLDVYTNRPFPKVFDAIDLVNEHLLPTWSSVDDPFPTVRKKEWYKH